MSKNSQGFVSIPYGSIKSHLRNFFKRLRKLFQFLMVRLKVLHICSVFLIITVSIPYGSIKRLPIR